MRSELDRYSNRASTTPIAETLPGQALQQDDRTTFGGSVEKYARWNFRDGAGAAVFVGAGLRYDRLEFDIHDYQRGLDVAPSIDIVQPKAGIVFSPLRGLSLFTNYSKSLLPPSAIDGQLSRNPALDALRLATKEVGVQYKSADGAWQVLADVYRTTFTNEILNQTPPLLPIYLGHSAPRGATDSTSKPAPASIAKAVLPHRYSSITARSTTSWWAGPPARASRTSPRPSSSTDST